MTTIANVVSAVEAAEVSNAVTSIAASLEGIYAVTHHHDLEDGLLSADDVPAVLRRFRNADDFYSNVSTYAAEVEQAADGRKVVYVELTALDVLTVLTRNIKGRTVRGEIVRDLLDLAPTRKYMV